jgi:hypothetical protein
MKWVKCIYSGSGNELTIGKIYKVINYSNVNKLDETVEIIKDDGELRELLLVDPDGIWFEDADAEVRDNKINDILK